MAEVSRKRPKFPEVGVLALVPDQWGPQWQTRHHVLARLAEYFEVVWVNQPRSWRQLFSRRLFSARRSAEAPVGIGLQIYDPGMWLPEFGRPAWLANLTLRKRLQRGRNLLLQRGCRQIVLYVWRPEFAGALDQMAYDLSCYHIDDEYSHSPRELPLDRQEARLLQKAGQVFIHSRTMMEKKGALNRHSEFIPNGVDYKLYSTPQPEPEDLRPISRPRIGYSGVLKNQMDWPLLLELSARHPQWSFVFVGAANLSWRSEDVLPILSARSNLHFLGAKTTQELARYAQHFQVCLLPYRVDGYTKFIYPLKLHEYLASGTPVVGSRISTLRDFESVISLADGPEEWSGSIAQALSPAANSDAARAARQSVARRHDWSVIVGKIAEAMGRRLGVQVVSAREGGLSPSPAGEPSPELSLLQ